MKVTIETGRNPERYEEIVWSYYDKRGRIREQLISHIVKGKFPDIKFITNKKFVDNKITKLSFNPAYILDVYAALNFHSQMILNFGLDNGSAFKVDFGSICKADYYIMPMRISK